MKKGRMLLLPFLFAMFMTVSSINICAATRSIPSCSYVESTSVIKKRAITISGGTVNVKVPAVGGFMKYTASKAGTYEIIFDNVKGIEDEELGYVSIYRQTGSSLVEMTVTTRGGKREFLKLRTEGYGALEGEYHLSRYAVFTLKKGQTIFINADFTGKVTMSVTVLRPGATRTCKLNQTSVTLKTGQSMMLSVARAGSKKVTWKSSNTGIATVSSQGKVTAKKAGTAKISAIVDGKAYGCTVTVKPNINERELIIALGAQKAYDLAKYPSTVHIRRMYYENWLRNGYGDAVKRLEVDAYSMNGFGGYGSFHVVVLKVPNKSTYSTRFLFNGNYYTANAFDSAATPCGVTVSSEEAERIYKKIYGSNAKAITFD